MKKKERLSIVMWAAYWGGLMSYAYTYLQGWRFLGLFMCMVGMSLLWALAPNQPAEPDTPNTAAHKDTEGAG